MKFGVCLPNFGNQASQRFIDRVLTSAEDYYDSVWTTDHIIVPKKYSDPYGHVYDALLTLAYAAAKTENVKLGTSVLVLPQRNPIIVAKETATLDQLSEGRLILGLGAGWMEEEYSNLGANFEGRGALMDESINLLRTLWKDSEPSFRGRFFKFASVSFQPLPVQKRGPPLWIGGASNAAIRRAARLGDGWHPVGLSADDLAMGVKKLAKYGLSEHKVVVSLRSRVSYSEGGASEYQSKQASTRKALGGNARRLSEGLEEYRRAGLEYLVCYFKDSEPEQMLTEMRGFATQVMPSFTG